MFILERIARGVVSSIKCLLVMLVFILIIACFIGKISLNRANTEYKACSWKYNSDKAYYMYR
jgi:hypothetical protein